MRVLLEGGDGSGGSKAHVARGVEGLYIEGGVVGEAGVNKGGFQSVFEVYGVLEAERALARTL